MKVGTHSITILYNTQPLSVIHQLFAQNSLYSISENSALENLSLFRACF